MPDLPKISVVTVSYNHAEFLRQNIESVLAQRYPNVEHIIVDGGSTDGTVEILKSYPHLSWTSERDRGQSDALNKGFARASGDIIAWLNSDDWYAPGVFHDIAAALADSPVVVGRATRCDRDGTPAEEIPNWGRTYYDLLKHWLNYAWLAQPAVFFRRSLLESVRYPDGSYLDESLSFSMDYDLWLRMARRHPFTKHLDKVLAYFRFYQESKTGSGIATGFRENSRVFRRMLLGSSRSEHLVSAVVPVFRPDNAIGTTLTKLAQQEFRPLEVLLVDCTDTPEDRNVLRDFTRRIEEAVPHVIFRLVRSEARTLYGAFGAGVRASSSAAAALVVPGDEPGPKFTLQLVNHFGSDPLAVIVPPVPGHDLKRELTRDGYVLDPGKLLMLPFCFPRLAVRRAAFDELEGFRAGLTDSHALRSFLFSVAVRGWGIVVDDLIPLAPAPYDSERERSAWELLASYMVPELLREAHERLVREPFSKVLALQNLDLAKVYEGSRASIEELLAPAPPGWENFEFADSIATLETTTVSHPRFAPAWLLLAREYERGGREADARTARERHRVLTDPRPG